MSTQDFRTKTMMIERKNISNDGEWDVAIDVGYSGVKLFSPNMIACFPAFASSFEGSLMTGTENSMKDMIVYKKDGESVSWSVGRAAQNAISQYDADASSMSIFGRQRYSSDMFNVLIDCALGIACKKNSCGDPKDLPVIVKTGLPVKYLQMDNPYIKEAFEGRHSFSLKLGTGKWEHFDIIIAKENVSVMPQPMGSLLSVVTGDDGKMRTEADLYYSNPTIICDPGFGTFDCFCIAGNRPIGQESFEAFGMKQVLMDTSNEIREKYNTEIPVPAMQKYLETGQIMIFNRKRMTSVAMPFDDILQKHCKDIAVKALARLNEIYNLDEYRYLILTGGTGEAWYPYFKDALKGLPTLTIVPGNQNTMGIITDVFGHPKPLPYIFSNVRGYYMALCHR